MVLPPYTAAERRSIMKKYCTKCGHEFEAIGREVICPSCKAAAAEEVKRAAVLRAKQASWTGESVPVRISGRASTVIRAYSAEKGLSFAAALDALLKASDCFKGMQMAWEDVTPYKSHRRDKHAQDVPQVVPETAQDVPQVVTKVASKPQETTSKPQDKQDTPQASKPIAARKTSKTKTSRTKTSKTSK